MLRYKIHSPTLKQAIRIAKRCKQCQRMSFNGIEWIGPTEILRISWHQVDSTPTGATAPDRPDVISSGDQ